MPHLEDGDCYEAAGMFLYWHHDDLAPLHFGVAPLKNLVLVHGEPTLQRPPWTKFGHAWNEYEDQYGNLWVRDTANGNDVTMEAEAYYALGKIDPATCRRYDREQMRLWALKTRNWGPWEGDSDAPDCEKEKTGDPETPPAERRPSRAGGVRVRRRRR